MQTEKFDDSAKKIEISHQNADKLPFILKIPRASGRATQKKFDATMPRWPILSSQFSYEASIRRFCLLNYRD